MRMRWTGLRRQNRDGRLDIREYREEDGKALAALFYHTVHTVNAKDYTKAQLDAWATGKIDLAQWNRSLCKQICAVAVIAQTIVGFGDITQTGYLDRLYVHRDFQRKGIASMLCDALERQTQGKIITHASITARPFFEKRGYRVMCAQYVERNGERLKNFVMEKG